MKDQYCSANVKWSYVSFSLGLVDSEFSRLSASELIGSICYVIYRPQAEECQKPEDRHQTAKMLVLAYYY